MEDIEVVIKLRKEDYERLKEYKKAPFSSLASRTYEAVANGTPLPEGHGKLVDASELASLVHSYAEDAKEEEDHLLDVFCNKLLNDAPPIIEADSTERKGKKE